MSWTFSDLTPVIGVRLMNPFLDVTYPTEGLAVASFDTGYTGFALVPNSVFQALRLNELRARSVPVTVADGRQVHVKEVFGLLEIA